MLGIESRAGGNGTAGMAVAVPVSSENGAPQNGDPWSPFSHEIGDPDPQFSNILGTLGSPILYNIRDPSVKLGTPHVLFFVLLNLAMTIQ